MFLRRKAKRDDKNFHTVGPKYFYQKKGWKITFLIVLAILIVSGSYLSYLIASGKKIFDPNNLTGSPFFAKGSNYELKGEGDGRINILVMGKGGSGHPGGELTDSMMVVSINPDNKTVAMLSVPRDLYVPVPGKKNYNVKINEIYTVGEKQKQGSGAALVKETVGNILDLPIHYYVSLDFYGFKKLVDQIGGIDVNVDKNLYDPFFPADDMKSYSPFNIKAGQHHLDGTTALKYARSRETTSDFDRALRQQKVIAAVKDKIFNLGFLANPKKLVDLVNVVGDHVRTDFTPNELYAMAKLIKDVDTSKIISKVLTNGSDGELVDSTANGAYILKPKTGNWEQIQMIAHEIFTDPNLTKENAKIEVLNGSNKAGLGSQLSEVLKSYSYNVINVDTAKSKYPKTIIYDYTNGAKKITLQFLKNRLSCEVVQKTSPGNNVDIDVIIGDNYQGFNKNP
ncbi:MAG: LCP family protein [Patescibacteria group bacterium]